MFDLFSFFQQWCHDVGDCWARVCNMCMVCIKILKASEAVTSHHSMHNQLITGLFQYVPSRPWFTPSDLMDYGLSSPLWSYFFFLPHAHCSLSAPGPSALTSARHVAPANKHWEAWEGGVCRVTWGHHLCREGVRPHQFRALWLLLRDVLNLLIVLSGLRLIYQFLVEFLLQ